MVTCAFKDQIDGSEWLQRRLRHCPKLQFTMKICVRVRTTKPIPVRYDKGTDVAIQRSKTLNWVWEKCHRDLLILYICSICVIKESNTAYELNATLQTREQTNSGIRALWLCACMWLVQRGRKNDRKRWALTQVQRLLANSAKKSNKNQLKWRPPLVTDREKKRNNRTLYCLSLKPTSGSHH